VEAGVSLDSAILRVARDMATTHPDLSSEFLIVNRRVNAGIPRERALQGLWERTGLEDLRGLVSSMVQSEKWGTSIAKVLRINAETLRRKRKQAAEKKAAEAGLKMMFPLMLFLLPALFVVILGPAAMSIATNFKGLQ
jgi:tight adherence protein C